MDISGFTNFEKAEQISAAASYLDDHKPAHVGHEHVDGIRHKDFLHSLARELAGNRVLELYQEN